MLSLVLVASPSLRRPQVLVVDYFEKTVNKRHSSLCEIQMQILIIKSYIPVKSRVNIEWSFWPAKFYEI